MVQPTDNAGLAEVRAALEGLLAEGKSELALDAAMALIAKMKRENDSLTRRVSELTRRLFGRSSERIDPKQMRLALQEVREQEAEKDEEPDDDDVPNDPEDKAEGESKSKKKKAGHRARRPLPPDLPREEIRLVPTTEQVDGKGKMSKVGEERSEALDYEPGRFKVLVYIRETWSNDAGEIVTAPPPIKIIEKGLPGPGLLTHVVLSKFVDHLPLARQVKIFERDGIELHRNRLVDWVAAVAFLLSGLAALIHSLAMNAHALQVDDTRLDVLDRNASRNIKRGHLWVMLGDMQFVSFRYTENWTAEKAAEFLGKRIGWMQVDGYKGYETLAKAQPLLLLVACLMHVRRYFVRALDAKDVRASEPLDIIKRIYEVEARSNEANEDHDQRFDRRQVELVPLLDELEAWKEKNLGVAPPKEPLGVATTYLDKHFTMLRMVEKDGALELDNGEVERVIRGPAMGRRNWLFAGSDEGGERTAIILTVLETAKRAGVDLREYLQDVLLKIAGGWKQSRLPELLPHNWARQREAGTAEHSSPPELASPTTHNS